jgi:hypothetical protein
VFLAAMALQISRLGADGCGDEGRSTDCRYAPLLMKKAFSAPWALPGRLLRHSRFVVLRESKGEDVVREAG